MTSVIPTWSLGDRMRKALDHSGHSAKAMARYFGVAPQTISNWLNGHHAPSRPALRLWATQTGVSYEWLVAGDVGVFQSDRIADLTAQHPDLSVDHDLNEDECAARDSNPEPADYGLAA